MAVGRISGPLLKENLIRNGVDLAFETDLLYLNVVNQRIGIKTDTPTHELQVNGTTRTTNLIVDNAGAVIGDITISGNTISSSTPYLNLGTLDNIVYQNKLRIDAIDIDTNVISTNETNANLELRPNGTGSVVVHSNMNVDGNIHATGNISADGNITLGNEDTDNVTFNAEVASDIIPDQDQVYNLGSNTKEWQDIWVGSLFATSINSGSIDVEGVDLTLRAGNIYYVATNGNDVNTGDHPQAPFKTIKYALTAASAGDTIHVYPGEYEEAFPLTIPVGVTVKGQGIRAVKIVPTAATQNNDAILLNGETTIEDLTIADFYSPGYAFKFAPNFTVTNRSPYVRNTSVLTKGSTANPLDPSDPLGYNAGDAGRGAYLDGSVATAGSNEAACLFHSVTFITPGVDAIELTNGVRVEWLNSFTYFANRSIYAYDGASGLKGTGQTALRVDEVTGTFSAGETISYYDTDGITLLDSATIASIDATGKIFVSGKQTAFETAAQRGGKTLVANGDAQLSTAVKKFGTASLALDGTGDYASIAANNDFGFGTGDFTVETWIYLTDLVGTQQVFDFRAGAVADIASTVYVSNGGQIRYYTDSADRITGSTLNSATWYHVALVKESGSTKLYVNGTQVGSTYTDANDYGTAKPLTIGSRYDGGNEFSGYIDDFRIVKGVAITPPAGGPTTKVIVTPETVLMARFDGDNASTTFTDDVVYAQDIRFSGGATANKITLTDFTDFGAEVRLIGSASVYGEFGLVGDGPGVLMYAIGHNLAYIGNGKEVTNDPTTVIQDNEVVEANGAKIRYTSVDHKGDFRVGDLFYVNQETGNVELAVSNFNINTTTGITLTDGSNTTFISGSRIDTGNLRISGNTIESLSGAVNIEAANDQINLNSNVNIDGNLDVTGNVTIGGNITIGDEATDTIQIVAGIESDLVPGTDSVHGLGTASKRWSNLWINQLNIDDIEIRDNYIETTVSNSNLELRANGTGIISIPNNNVVIDNDLTVNGTSTFGDMVINGSINITGNTSQQGDLNIDGNVSATQDLDVSGAAQFEEILIDDNFITTTTSNTNLELRANGTGVVLIPNNNVTISNNMTVVADIDANNLTSTGTLTTDIFTNGDLTINDNYITTTASNSNLELRASGTGLVYIPTNDVVIEQNLTVNGSTALKDTTLVGTITQTGDVVQTGNFALSGDFTNGNILINDNTISTTESNSDLDLRASGTGKVIVPNNDVEIAQDLTVSGSTDLQDTTVTGIITHTGNTTQTGTYTIAGSWTNGDLEFNGNVITTTQSNSNLDLRANGTGVITVPNNDVEFAQDLTVSGTTDLQDTNITGTITHVGDVTHTGNYNITGDITNGDILIKDNFIATTDSNSDLELRANGTGVVRIPNNDTVFEQDVTVVGDTTLSNLTVVGLINHTGNVTQTGNINLTGNYGITGTVTISSTAQFENIQINDNIITTTESNSDLDLRAAGTGRVIVPDNNVVINDTLTVNGTINVTDVSSIGTVTVNSFTTGDILIDDNYITTTQSNSNLELRANGTGTIYVPSNDLLLGQDLTVDGTTTLSTTNINGTLTHTGNVVQTGNFNLTGTLAVTGAVTISSSVALENIFISGNTIETTDSNSDLELRANGSGVVSVPNNDVEITNDLTVNGTLSVSNITSTGSISANSFTTGDILIDDNYITTTNSNSTLELRTSGTGSILVDQLNFNGTTISSAGNITVTPGSGIFDINSTGAVSIPSGTTLERPNTPAAGQIRFNTSLGRYEGYDGSNWIKLNGVQDLDGNTSVTAELTPGANDDTIRFTVAGSTVVDINATRLSAPKVTVDNLVIDGNQISTVASNTDILISANGTGSVVIDNFAIRDNVIKNTVSNSVTTFENTANGYVKIDGTGGFVIPVGDNTNRPSILYTEVGMTRFNTDESRVEVWDGGNWVSAAGSSSGISRSEAENLAFEIVLSLG